MKHAIPERPNTALFIMLLAMHGLMLFGVPSMAQTTVWWGLVLLPFAWFNIVHWGLIHEAIHKILFTHPRANEWGGRILSILMGPSFHVLRFGHLIHHQLNRHWHAEIIASPQLADKITYYFHLLFGLYLSELTTSWLMSALPQQRFMNYAKRTVLKDHPDVAIAGERFFYTRGNVRATRVDTVMSLLLYCSAFYLAGQGWIWIAAFLILRGIVISFMDNVYHFATPTDNSKAGKELQLPSPISALLLHGNYHETHHLNPNAPWAMLPYLHADQQRGFDGPFLLHGIQQFSWPAVKE